MTRRTLLFFIAVFALILISVCAFIFATRSRTSQPSSALFPIIEKGKYGYIDRNGKVIIKPQFDMAKRFSEGLARVRVGSKWGFIDQTGKIIIRPQFEISDIGDNNPSLDFHEGMAAVSLDEGNKWGYIDRTGKMIIAPRYGAVDRFSEGLAFVADRPHAILVKDTFNQSPEPVVHSWYIDKTGNAVSFPLVGETFSEGLAVISAGKGENRKFGYIDKTGQVRVKPQFGIARPFREELASVRPGNDAKWGYIDKTGKMVIPERSLDHEPGEFSEGLAAMPIKSHFLDDKLQKMVPDNWGFIDKSGKFVIAPKFETVGRFSEGLAGACVIDESLNSGTGGAICGYIDKSGRWAINEGEFKGGVMSDFYEGLALICHEHSCGYIDQNGNYIWRTSERIDPWRLTGCTIWNVGDPDYGRDWCWR